MQKLSRWTYFFGISEIDSLGKTSHIIKTSMTDEKNKNLLLYVSINYPKQHC